MKKIFYLSITLLSFIFGNSTFGQQTIQVGTSAYENAKVNGTLTNYTVVTPNRPSVRPLVSTHQLNRTPTECFGYTPPNLPATRDSMSDDDSSPLIPLPFNFCMYGQNYTSCHVNSNGNVTFSGGRITFTSTGFPSTSGNPMLAPFWADIDMRGGGSAYYEVFPDAVIVHWVNCGYFNAQSDKRVTLQLIFTDGNSPLLPPGNNVGFFYENMDWTTGSASGGTNGFGGTAMTVGVDNGDGTNGFQLGRFDKVGMAYDGPFGANDGIDWLDNKSFIFNVCNSSNIPPVVNGIQVCDTLRICLGDSLPINFDVLAVEQNQTSGIIMDTTGVVGYNLISYTDGISGANGNPASLSAYFRPFTVDTVTLGIKYFDNGIPLDTLLLDLVIIVDTLPYNPILSSDTTICLGTRVDIGAGNFFDSYSWTDTLGSQISIDSLASLPTGWNYLEVVINGCVDNDSIFVDSFPDNSPVIIGPNVYCAPDSVLLVIDTFPEMLWTINQGLDTISMNDSIYAQAGFYTVTILDTNSCSFFDTVRVAEFQSLVNIQGNATYCPGDSVLLTVPPIFDTYTWSDGSTGTSTYGFEGETSIVVTGLNGCLAYDTININEIVVPLATIQGNNLICPGTQTPLSFTNPGYNSFRWLPSNSTANPINVSSGSYRLRVNFLGCIDTTASFVVSNAVIEDMDMTFLNTVCLNDSILLMTNNNYNSYSWNTGANTPGIYVTQSGTYTLNVVDANGCLDDTTITVNAVTNPPVITSQDAQVCMGDNFGITGTIAPGGGNWTYEGPTGLNFSPNTTFINPSISVSQPGTYIVKFTDARCPFVDSIVLEYIPLPNLQLLGDSTGLCKGEEFVIKALTSDPSNTTWLPVLETGDSIIVSEEGTYTVTLNNFCGILTDEFYVRVEDCEVPNIITPNGDGQNEVFRTSLADSYSDVNLMIFNRWGGKVYKNEKYDNTWNGVDNGGNKLSEGTYYYIITYDNDTKSEKGFITLMR